MAVELESPARLGQDGKSPALPRSSFRQRYAKNDMSHLAMLYEARDYKTRVRRFDISAGCGSKTNPTQHADKGPKSVLVSRESIINSAGQEYQPMSSKKAQNNIVHTARCGPVVIDILRGTTMDGHSYLYYQPSRAWQTKNSPRENFSPRFYDRNERDFVEAIKEASKWIRNNPQAADPSSQVEQIAA